MNAKRIEALVVCARRRCTLLAAALALGFSSAPAWAANVLVTPPYFGSTVSSGFARCLATNIGPTSASITITLYDNDGTALVGPDTVTIAPNHTLATPEVNLASADATTCTFSVSNKKAWRASFFVVPSASGSGTDVIVVPAQ